MSRRHRIAAAVAAGALGLSSAVGLAACGSSEGGREDPERGNLGDTSSQSPQEVETGPTTLGSTGETQPTVDQTETGP
jgi:hypothetical protein